MSDLKAILGKNLEELRGRIGKAAAKTGRSPDDITMIAVTKTIPVEQIKEIISLGVLDLGENRVQELSGKHGQLNKACRWHLIGHLQTNKVKQVLDKVCMIHSLDSIELAREIQKRASSANRTMDVLVQVNVAQEESKFGIKSEETLEFVRELSRMDHLKVRGLMTIAPYTPNPEEIRYVFKGLRKLLIDIRAENIDNISMDYLSMGMSNDFEVAIEEGSNMIRVGTALFGHRTT